MVFIPLSMMLTFTEHQNHLMKHLNISDAQPHPSLIKRCCLQRGLQHQCCVVFVFFYKVPKYRGVTNCPGMPEIEGFQY